MNKTLLWSTFQTTVIYDEVLREVCATFGIETFQEEQQKAIDMFSEGNDVSVSLPTGSGKSLLYRIFNISPLFSRLEPAATFIAPPIKDLTEDQVHYLSVLGLRGLSAFNSRSLCERCCEDIKLKLVVSCSDSFD